MAHGIAHPKNNFWNVPKARGSDIEGEKTTSIKQGYGMCTSTSPLTINFSF